MLGAIIWTALGTPTQKHLWLTLGRIGVKNPREGKRGASKELWSGVEKLLSPEPSTLESEEERTALLKLIREAMTPLETMFHAAPESCDSGMLDIMSDLVILHGKIRELPLAA